MSGKRMCVFCGQSLAGQRRAKEHIYPRWLQQTLNLGGQELYYYTLDRVQGVGDPKRRLLFGAHVGGHVCRDCNCGRMSRLETGEMIVAPAPRGAIPRWNSGGPLLGREIAQEMRAVLLADDSH